MVRGAMNRPALPVNVALPQNGEGARVRRAVAVWTSAPPPSGSAQATSSCSPAPLLLAARSKATGRPGTLPSSRLSAGALELASTGSVGSFDRQTSGLVGLGHGDRHQAHEMWAGRPGLGCRAFLRRVRRGMVGCGHDQADSITCIDHARAGGHADLRARILAVSEPPHPALARQRISPSRRP